MFVVRVRAARAGAVISCRAFGPPRVTIDGQAPPPEILWRKNLALLVYLAGSPQWARSREHLIGLLWGDKPDRSARHSLREAVRVLRRAGGQELIQAEAETLRLNADLIAFDTDRFESHVGAHDWRAAAELVGGEFMEGLAVPDAPLFEDWLSSERLSWRHRSVDALGKLASEAFATGDLATAAKAGQRALALAPTSDRAVRVAMRAAALADDRKGALARYERFEHHLEEAGGSTPAAETKSLADRIRSDRKWRLPTYVVQAGSRGAESRRAPLVGRGNELSALLSAWETCRGNGKASLAVIRAGSGLGKTRLVDEIVARARLEGAALSTFHAVPADEESPLAGLMGLAQGGLIDAGGLAAAHAGALGALAGKLGEWAERFPNVNSEVEAWTPQDAFGEVARVIAEEQPLLLIVDDVQWLDRDSLLALEAVNRDRSSLPMFTVLACDPATDRVEVDEFLARLGRGQSVVAIDLAPLTVDDVTELARWAFPNYSREEQQRVARRVWADSAGLPLLAVELYHAICLGLDLAGSSGAWPQPLKTLDQTLPGDLPEAVVAAIRVGFRRLTPDAQLVLGAAPVLGDRISAEMIARATGLSTDRAESALDELEWQRWLASDRVAYSFIAGIVRRVIDQDMIPAGRRRRFLSAAGVSDRGE